MCIDGQYTIIVCYIYIYIYICMYVTSQPASYYKRPIITKCQAGIISTYHHLLVLKHHWHHK